MGSAGNKNSYEAAINSPETITPSRRQLLYQRGGFYGFIHFGMNTFTDCGWGTGKESPALFNPADLNTDQWVEAMKAAGMKGIILTAKHHDGFCLWPSRYTEHSVKTAPWRNGQGDVVADLAGSCRKFGLKLGIYLSPWDRNHPDYGSESYNDYFANQLTELLSDYGDIFAVWFDGACGDKNKNQPYDWDRFYQIIRELQPNAVISNCGPDVRWCGNEAGYCRPQEWSVVPERLSDTILIASASQQDDNSTFAKACNPRDNDLGSRSVIRSAGPLIWYPSEVDVSIRPEWFYHAKEDNKLKSLTKLLRIYLNAVGGNNGLLLNVPVNQQGLIPAPDVARLRELGDALQEMFDNDLVSAAAITVSPTTDSPVTALADGDESTFWEGDSQADVVHIDINFGKSTRFNLVDIQEFIEKGQRLEQFTLSVPEGTGWKVIYTGTTVGNCKLCLLEEQNSEALRLSIHQCRAQPVLRALRVFHTSAIAAPTLWERARMAVGFRVNKIEGALYERFFMN